MTFDGKRRLSFWLGFALAAVLMPLTFALSAYPTGSIPSQIGGFTGFVLIMAFFAAAITSNALNRGRGKGFYTDAGSRGNPYYVSEVEDNLSGAFADGYVKFFFVALLLGCVYVLAFGPK